VEPIVEAVRARGDEAVREYTSRFDKVDLDDVCIPLEVRPWGCLPGASPQLQPQPSEPGGAPCREYAGMAYLAEQSALATTAGPVCVARACTEVSSTCKAISFRCALAPDWELPEGCTAAGEEIALDVGVPAPQRRSRSLGSPGC